MATIEQYRAAKSMCASLMKNVEDADRAVREFGAPISSYHEARKQFERASELLNRATADLPEGALAAEESRLNEEKHALEATSEFEGSVRISRGLDSVWMTTEEAVALVEQLQFAIKMSR